jgi:hypothetical protein
MNMQKIGFRTAAALTFVATLGFSLPALVANVAAQDRKDQHGAPAAPHVAPAAPAPRAAPAAPPPAPHVSAPAPAPHVAAPAPHIAAPAPHVVAAPAPRISAPAAHVSAPVHTATPHAPAPQITRPSGTSPAALARQQQQQERRLSRTASPQNARQPANGATGGAGNLAHRGAPPVPNAATQSKTAPSVANRPNTNPNAAIQNRTAPNTGNNKAAPNAPSVVGSGNRGQQTQQAQAQAQARAQIYSAANRRPVLHNPAFANLSPRDPASRALASSTFRGGFAQYHDRFRGQFRDRFGDLLARRGAVVIGWIGPVFWPYAYADLVDYTLWPYANDTFWPYAYNDVYDSIFGGYAPALSSYANAPDYGSRSGGRRRSTAGLPAAGLPAPGETEVCTGQESGLTDWPIEQIAQQVGPNDAQRALLDKLKDATAMSVDILKSACPIDLPSTPTGRLAAMRQRIQIMSQAVQTVRPALDAFYRSLSDEQKERFNAIGLASSPSATRTRSARSTGGQQPDIAQVCSGRATQVTSLPTDRIQQALRLNESQRAALQDLSNASTKAAAVLSENCPQDTSLTPPGRLAAMEQRLSSMLQALDTVQPALAKFYSSLNDEQKAQFDRLPPRQVGSRQT